MPIPPEGRAGFLRARRVLTMQEGTPPGDAVWWEHGVVRAVGPAHLLEPAVPRGVPKFEFRNALVTPGFVDGHTHFAMWALNRRRVQLVGARTRGEAVRRVAAASPAQGWILGQGWDANGWSEPPDRESLDAVAEVPVYLDSLDVHAAWLNSAALRRCRISSRTPDPFGGRIVRDAAGKPTGLLLERAVELALPHLPTPPAETVLEAVREAQAEAHRLGVTGIHDVEGDLAWDTFRTLESAGELRLRVLFSPPAEQLLRLLGAGRRSGEGSGWLTMGGVKLFLDGSLGSRTAWMLEPYEGVRDRGMPITDGELAWEAMRLAAGGGIAVAVHAIGDAAVRRALDLMERLPQVAIPHRIEHLQCVHPSDLARAGRAGIVSSMQPAHLLTDIPLVDRHWGARGRGTYAFRSLLAAGNSLVFGSDVPVASIDPREGVYAALERRGFDGAPAAGWRPEERIGFEQVLHAYTTAAARAAGVSHRRGTLAPGQDADFVAWEVDPLAERGDGEAFRRGRAVLTVVGGIPVMRA